MAYTKAVRAAVLPWNQRREQRAAASTSTKSAEGWEPPTESATAIPIGLACDADSCGGTVSLLVSRGTWVSESLDGTHPVPHNIRDEGYMATTAPLDRQIAVAFDRNGRVVNEWYGPGSARISR